ncbi:MAG: hypothetical protein WBM44_25470 [Waterburya sp.]
MIATNKTDLEGKQSTRQDNVTALYIGLTYEDYEDREQWLPMMRISWDDAGYYYHSFTKAFQENYELVKGNVLNPRHGYTQTWKDKRIAGIFDGRIPRRADSMESYDIFGVGDSKGDFISLFARNGGIRHGDRYDVFPEITPNAAGEYEFWFRIYDLPTLIRDGHDEVRFVADTIEVKQRLDLEVGSDKTKIYCQGVHIGHCPHYIHYLLSNNPEYKHGIAADIVNRNELCYEDKIIAKLTLKASEPIFARHDLEPINHMPV